MYKVLLLGCGNSLLRKVSFKDREKDFSDSEVIKIDLDPNCGADFVRDMNEICTCLPFEDETFDEIHAYDSLEHWGKQGDWKSYFDEFAEYHRILKTGGGFHCSVPINSDWFADPGHVRFFSVNHFGFLTQTFYKQIGKTSATDYRHYWKKNFDIILLEESQDKSHLSVLMVKT